MEIDLTSSNLDEIYTLLKMVDLDRKYYIHTNVNAEDREKDTYILLETNSPKHGGGFAFIDNFSSYKLLSKRIHEIVNERMLGDH